jgi:hypothetical protein
MTHSPDRVDKRVAWPPAEGEQIAFKMDDVIRVGVLKAVRLGLVWRDFVLEDGRTIPEHKVIGCPKTTAWRDPDSVSAEERQTWEARLVTMAESGMDPHDREHAFWADLTHYLAYTYLRLKKTKTGPKDHA